MDEWWAMADGRVRTSQSGCTAANRAFPAPFSSDSGAPILRYRRLLTGRAALTARVRVPLPPSAAGAKCFAAVSICDQSILRLDAYPEFAASGCDIQLAFDASGGLKFPSHQA